MNELSHMWNFWNVMMEKTLESPLDCKENQPIYPKGNQSWIFIGKAVAEAEAPVLWPPDEELTHWKRSWCWERLKAVGEGDNRGWDSWMTSSTRWTWVYATSGRWWWPGKLGVLQPMELQRVRHNWVTKQQKSWSTADMNQNWHLEWAYWQNCGLPMWC